MSKTGIRFIAALAFAGASVFPTMALAQQNYGGSGGNGSEMHYRMQWQGDQPYYYDQGHHRHNMSTSDVRGYAKSEDPHWYAKHRGESDRDFMRDWQVYYSKNTSFNKNGQ